MKKLTVLLFSILISFNSYGGWFGSDIKGAFGVELGDINTDASGSLSPKKSLPMFDSYDFFTTPISNKIYRISAFASSDYKSSYPGGRDCSKAHGEHFHDIKDMLEAKYGKFKYNDVRAPNDSLHIEIDEYIYKSKSREIRISCTITYQKEVSLLTGTRGRRKGESSEEYDNYLLEDLLSTQIQYYLTLPNTAQEPLYFSYFLKLSYVDLELESLRDKEREQLKKEEEQLKEEEVRSKSRGYDI
jgi:hypothetical protein